MAESQIHIVRDGVELGAFSISDADELLASGFLFPSDCFWTTDNSKARPLPELRLSGRSTTQHKTKALTISVLTVADTLRQKATNVAAKVGASVNQQRHEIDSAKARLLQDFLPGLQSSASAVFAASSRTLESALRDEPFLRKLFGAVYDVIPRSIQRFIPEHTFVEFCLRNRNRLLITQTADSAVGEPEKHA